MRNVIRKSLSAFALIVIVSVSFPASARGPKDREAGWYPPIVKWFKKIVRTLDDLPIPPNPNPKP